MEWYWYVILVVTTVVARVVQFQMALRHSKWLHNKGVQDPEEKVATMLKATRVTADIGDWRSSREKDDAPPAA